MPDAFKQSEPDESAGDAERGSPERDRAGHAALHLARHSVRFVVRPFSTVSRSPGEGSAARRHDEAMKHASWRSLIVLFTQ